MEYSKVNWKDYPSDSTLLTAENLEHMDDGIKRASEEITKVQESIKEIADIVYPVGSLYFSVSNVNPGNLFGGTWTSFAVGRTVIGISPDDEDFSETEKTGGSKAKKITESNLPAHKHSFTPEGTIADERVSGQTDETVVEHSHQYGYSRPEVKTAVNAINMSVNNGSLSVVFEHQVNAKMSNTAPDTTPHKHSFTSHSHSHVFSGKKKDTENTGESKELEILPPYVTCYIWKRIR